MTFHTFIELAIRPNVTLNNRAVHYIPAGKNSCNNSVFYEKSSFPQNSRVLSAVGLTVDDTMGSILSNFIVSWNKSKQLFKAACSNKPIYLNVLMAYVFLFMHQLKTHSITFTIKQKIV